MIHHILQVLAWCVLSAAGIFATFLTIGAFAWLCENLKPVAFMIACGLVMWAAHFVGVL